MDPDTWAQMMPPGLRNAHMIIAIGCPDDYPEGPPVCTPGAEPIMVVAASLDTPEEMIPGAVLASMLHTAADQLAARVPHDDLSDALRRAIVAAAEKMHGVN